MQPTVRGVFVNGKPPTGKHVLVFNKSEDANERVVDVSRRTLGLYVMTVTCTKNIEKAVKIQSTWLSKLGPNDRSGYVCDPGCEAAAKGALTNMWAFNKSDYFPGGKCTRFESHCNGYVLASLKYAAGFVGHVRRLLDSGSPMPKWWLLKDDDAYVDAPRLMAAINKTGADPSTPISFADIRTGVCNGICGGAGWVLSGALAERVVTGHADRFLKLIEDGIQHGDSYWDNHVPEVVHWVPGAQLLDMPEMRSFGPDNEQCDGLVEGIEGPPHDDRVNHTEDTCHASKACACARAAQPAAWHLEDMIKKRGLDNAVKFINANMSSYP